MTSLEYAAKILQEFRRGKRAKAIRRVWHGEISEEIVAASDDGGRAELADMVSRLHDHATRLATTA